MWVTFTHNSVFCDLCGYEYVICKKCANKSRDKIIATGTKPATHHKKDYCACLLCLATNYHPDTCKVMIFKGKLLVVLITYSVIAHFSISLAIMVHSSYSADRFTLVSISVTLSRWLWRGTLAAFRSSLIIVNPSMCSRKDWICKILHGIWS